MTTPDVGSARIDTPYMQGRPPGGCSPCRGWQGGVRGRAGVPARRIRAVLGRFFLGVRGAAAIETAFAVFVLVTAFAGVMQTVNTVFVDDQAGRAARAAARALALNPGTDPWGPIWEELYSNANHGCTTDWTASNLGTCDGWTLAVARDVSPATLAATLGPNPSASTVDGNLVLIGLSRSPATIPGVGNANANSNTSRTAEDIVKMDSVGVARSEPEA